MSNIFISAYAYALFICALSAIALPTVHATFQYTFFRDVARSNSETLKNDWKSAMPTDASICALEGVGCDDHGLVHRLILHFSFGDQFGTINIPGSIINLPYLEHLEIQHTKKMSFIPTRINQLSQLRVLLLSNNGLVNIDNLVNASFISEIEYLDLSANSLTEVPFSLFNNMKKLVYLNISHNSIVLPLDPPPFIKRLASLNYPPGSRNCNLSENSLEGGADLVNALGAYASCYTASCKGESRNRICFDNGFPVPCCYFDISTL